MCPQFDRLQHSKPTEEETRLQKLADEVWTELDGGIDGISTNETSEDCLTLNVWAPMTEKGQVFKKGQLLPVMVFIHGGDFYSGTANLNRFEGKFLTYGTHAVVVTLNYRLGALGFFHSTSEQTANVGLMDQASALEWVQANIEHFGGDKNQVTVFGESAGSASVNYLMMSPKSENLMNRVILESGVATCHWAYIPPHKARERSANLAKRVGCPSKQKNCIDEEAMACLRGQDAKTIIKVAQDMYNESNAKDNFVPTTDALFFPFTPEDALKREINKKPEQAKDVMIGYNANEGGYFVATSPLPHLGKTWREPLREETFDLLLKVIADRGSNSVQSMHRWFKTAKNRGASAGPLPCPSTHSLAPLTRVVALFCLLARFFHFSCVFATLPQPRYF